MADAVKPEWIRETLARARQIEPLLAPGLILAELPPTTFRCAVCGRRVSRYDPSDARLFRARSYDVDECPEHGPLADVELDEWHATWVRRGRPARLTMRQSPV
jgi:hypothetical protein